MSRRLRQQQVQPVTPPLSKRRRALSAPAETKPPVRRTLTIGTGSIVSVLALILLLGAWARA